MAKMDKSPSEKKEEKRALEALEAFVQYTSSPWRLMWHNFVAGVFRGLGALIGASIVIALLIWLASLFVNVPLIGEYAKQVKDVVQGYVNETNYNDELNRMGDSLERIEKQLDKTP